MYCHVCLSSALWGTLRTCSTATHELSPDERLAAPNIVSCNQQRTPLCCQLQRFPAMINQQLQSVNTCSLPTISRNCCLTTAHSPGRVSPTAAAVPQEQTLRSAQLVGLICSGLVALQSGLPLSLAAAPITPGDSPYLEAKRLAYGPTEDGRVRSCPTNINPNCVSTGSTNDAYAPAWFAPQDTPAAAADDLERAVLASVEGSDILQQVTLASGAEYRAFSAPSLFGQDVLEFVIKPDKPSGQLVTYRSMAGSVKYIWPIQQPIGDFDAQRKRLGLIKNNLVGWTALGCELIECYQ